MKDLLIQARDLIRNNRWTTGAYARTDKGSPIGATCEGAKCFCMLGAFKRIANDDYNLYKKLIESTGMSEKSIEIFNDEIGRTKGEVIQFLNRKIDEYETSAN